MRARAVSALGNFKRNHVLNVVSWKGDSRWKGVAGGGRQGAPKSQCLLIPVPVRPPPPFALFSLQNNLMKRCCVIFFLFLSLPATLGITLPRTSFPNSPTLSAHSSPKFRPFVTPHSLEHRLLLQPQRLILVS